MNTIFSQAEFGIATIDGHEEKIGNYRIEPPGVNVTKLFSSSSPTEDAKLVRAFGRGNTN
jgi:Eukaryotic DNA topoisomerase I, DNA binding fragment